MKRFKQLIAEIAQPKSEDELNFKDKHEIEMIDHPESEEHQHTAEKKSPKRRADYKDGEDMAVYEAKHDDEEVDENAFVAKAAAAKKAGKGKFKLGDKEFPVTIKKDVADKVMKENATRKLVEKAKSEAQQKAAAVALAVKRGDMPKSALQGASKDMYKMSEKDLEDFAKTKHKGIPKKVEEDFDLDEAVPAKKAIMRALQGIKAQPKEKVSLKKAPWEKNEEVELDEAKTDIYHKHMLKALGKSRLPKNHQYTSAIATNGDFVVKDGGSRIVGRIPKGEHDLKESEQINEISKKTLGSYVRKAADDMAYRNASKSSDYANTAAGHKAYTRNNKKRVQRQKGIDIAVYKMTGESTDLNENFKTGSMTLNDGSKVIVNKKDADLLNQMFKDLNATNRSRMMKVAMTDKAGFEEILGFAREAL